MEIRTRLERVQPIIVATAVLHNICKKMRDPMPPLPPNWNEDNDSSDDEDETVYTAVGNEDCNRSLLITNYFSRFR